MSTFSRQVASKEFDDTPEFTRTIPFLDLVIPRGKSLGEHFILVLLKYISVVVKEMRVRAVQ